MTPEEYSDQMRALRPFRQQFQRRCSDAEDRRRPGRRRHHLDRYRHEDCGRSATAGRSISPGMSLHSYTVFDAWPPHMAATGFDEQGYANVLGETLKMGPLIDKQSAVMDKYDPDKKVSLVVDEWGRLVRQDAGQPRRLPGPAELPARRRPGRAQSQHLRPPRRSRPHGQLRPDDQRPSGHDPDRWSEDGADADLSRLPHVRAVPRRHRHSCQNMTPAAMPRALSPAPSRRHRRQGTDGKIWLSLTNLDPNQPLEVDASALGFQSEVGDRPDPDRAEARLRPSDAVTPKPISATGKNGAPGSETAAGIGHGGGTRLGRPLSSSPAKTQPAFPCYTSPHLWGEGREPRRSRRRKG